MRKGRTDWQQNAKSLARMIDGVMLGCCVILLAGIVLAIFAQVVFRYLLEAPLVWSEEVSRTAFVWLTFLGAAVLAGRGEHLSIAAIDAALPARAGRLLAGAFALVGAAVFGFIVVAAAQMIDISAGQVSPATGLPVAVLYLAPFVGGIAGNARCLMMAILAFAGRT